MNALYYYILCIATYKVLLHLQIGNNNKRS